MKEKIADVMNGFLLRINLIDKCRSLLFELKGYIYNINKQQIERNITMKTFQLVHVLSEFEVCTITLTETEISMDPTVPLEDYEKAMKLEV